VKKLKSFVEDSSDFLRQIEGMKLGENELMFSMDVVALYPSVPKEGGRNAMRKNLEQRTDKSIPTEELMELAKLVLETNETVFEGRQVVQVDGTAIGSKRGKNYACAYMGQWEQEIHQEAKREKMRVPRKWWRFVVNMFGVWRGSVESFLAFVGLCNN
jgi:hypothetical protein